MSWLKLCLYVLAIVGLLTPLNAKPERHWLTQKIEVLIKKRIPQMTRADLALPSLTENIPTNAEVLLTSQNFSMGLVPVEVQWREGEVHRERAFTVRAKVFGPVAVAASLLRHGERVASPAFKFEEREMTPYLNSGFFSESKDLEGLQVKGLIRPGEVFSALNTQAPFLIQRGQTVTLERNHGGLHIFAKVKALQDGRSGDWIGVENFASRKSLRAQVIGEATVAIP